MLGRRGSLTLRRCKAVLEKLRGALARRLDDEDPRPRRRWRAADRAQADQGQAHDGRSAEDMLETMCEGTILLADRASNSDERRERRPERGV